MPLNDKRKSKVPSVEDIVDSQMPNELLLQNQSLRNRDELLSPLDGKITVDESGRMTPGQLSEFFSSPSKPSRAVSSQAPFEPAIEIKNPLVREYMTKKILGEELSPEALLEAQKRAEERKGSLALPQFLQGLGEAIQGRSPESSARMFQQLRQNIDDAEVGAFEKRRKTQIENQNFEAQQRKANAEAEMVDPSSPRSVAFRKSIEANFPRIAQSYGPLWEQVSAQDQALIFKPLELKEQIEARKQTAQILAQDRESQRQQKLEEKLDELKTPYGIANTKDDAKQLKEAYESKANFDAKLDEMIALRKKHGGGAILNREDVARGKQLSKDLLLEYKNMAKLGVLSKSDEDIINAIIPEDPLAFDWVPGQDPILSNLEKFRRDSDQSFNTKVATRIKGASSKRFDEPKEGEQGGKKPTWAK